jgi:hypothetical protein
MRLDGTPSPGGFRLRQQAAFAPRFAAVMPQYILPKPQPRTGLVTAAVSSIGAGRIRAPLSQQTTATSVAVPMSSGKLCLAQPQLVEQVPTGGKAAAAKQAKDPRRTLFQLLRVILTRRHSELSTPMVLLPRLLLQRPPLLPPRSPPQPTNWWRVTGFHGSMSRRARTRQQSMTACKCI